MTTITQVVHVVFRVAGGYKYQFTVSGTYYYWSGSVDDSDRIQMRGVVIVNEAPPSFHKVTLSIKNIQATYNVGGMAI